MSNMQDNGEVEMFTLRRSARIAEKQRVQFVENISAFNTFVKKETPKPKTPRKKSNDVAKMNVDIQIKKKARKTKKTNKNTRKIIDKFANLEKTKLNDIFPLIKKYSSIEDEKNEKYFILETIIKKRKAINIDNLLIELYIHKNNIVIYLYNELLHSEYSFTLDIISNHLNDILSYREVDDLDTVIMNRNNENICKSKRTAEYQMRNDLQEIEKLNAMICRLMM
jgi:hypothetical protein